MRARNGMCAGWDVAMRWKLIHIITCIKHRGIVAHTCVFLCSDVTTNCHDDELSRTTVDELSRRF